MNIHDFFKHIEDKHEYDCFDRYDNKIMGSPVLLEKKKSLWKKFLELLSKKLCEVSRRG